MTNPGFFAELKRRNVPRAAVLYAGAVWAISQGVSQLSPAIGLPDYATRWFLIAAIIGFPLWIAFAWFYEFTPGGIKRESEVAEDAPSRHSTARRLDFAIIGVLVVAVVLLASGYLVKREPAASMSAVTKAAPFNPAKNTLVVLPFKNLSGDPKQQYFSDGITEELTNALGQNAALRVTAWDTSSRFRDPNESATEVARKLNVANVLLGSIQRESDQVRVTAELVNAVTGQQLWSQHYDDSFANIFAVQDKVSQAIAQALQVKFAQADLPAGGTRNPQAHDLVLKGRALMDKFDAASFEAARKDFEQAIALDPNYADAHALLSRALIGLTERSDLPLKATLPQIRAEAEKALALDPNNVDAWVMLGVADSQSDPPDRAKAKAELQKALALDPSNVAAHIDYGILLPLKPGVAEFKEATQLDPDSATAWNNLATNDQDLGDWAQMVTAAQALIRLDPQGVDSAFYLAYAYQQLRQDAKMVAAFDLVKPANAVDQQQVAAGRLVYQSLLHPALRPQALAAVQQLARYQSNTAVAVNLPQLWLALGEHAEALKQLQGVCLAMPIACIDLAINPTYTALRTDPRFQKLVKRYNTVTMQ
jgi:TolB-like protein/tetratricopeptide (TPR) repeat protein